MPIKCLFFVFNTLNGCFDIEFAVNTLTQKFLSNDLRTLWGYIYICTYRKYIYYIELGLKNKNV